MPLYSFMYVNENGEEICFDEFLPLSECDKPVYAPDGKTLAKRILSTFAIHNGLTAVEKTAGTTKRRVDFAGFSKDQMQKRKKQADPGTRAYDSNEYWLGGESFKNVLSHDPIKKTQETKE
jgi:hypothetical protein